MGFKRFLASESYLTLLLLSILASLLICFLTSFSHRMHSVLYSTAQDLKIWWSNESFCLYVGNRGSSLTIDFRYL